ncbi:YmfQ family protein [Clostridium saccharoperbutylacetonicum]|uniref:YmfQ family protein n=1 Tax=Clostridium saccharoperbutylacetonicum TaxID=36745 RepID=UPI0039ED25F7
MKISEFNYFELAPNSEELEKYCLDLTKYVPPFICQINEMKATYDVQGRELGSLNYSISDLSKQCFIDTATWGLLYWEDEYGIETNLSLSYEQRREILKAKKRGQGTTTKAMLKNAAEAFSGGEVSIIEDNENYLFVIQFVGVKGIPQNMQAFMNMLEDIKPAHLTYNFKYTYTIWNFIMEKKLNWNNIKTKNWEELKIYE